jgi:fatty-acyl-CoA synthase
VNSTMMQFPLTLQHVLDRAGQYFAGREVVWRQPDGSVARTTYGDVAARSRRLGTALAGLGLMSGDRVATLGWNHAQHLEAYFGVPTYGFVLHTINPRLHPDDIAHIVRTAADRALLIDESLLPLLDQLPDDVRPPIVIVWSAGGNLPSGAYDYEELLASTPTGLPFPELAEDAAASMCFTSATTGRPKGVVYSHRAIVLHSIVTAMPDEFGLSGHDVVMPVVPMFHVNAWGIPFTTAMIGAKLVLPGPQMMGPDLLSLIEDEQVTMTAGVPTVWTRLLETVAAGDRQWDLSSVRTVLIGGSAASPAMIEAIDALGPRVLHAWGMTETSPLGSVSRLRPEFDVSQPGAALRYRAAQGTPAPLVEARAVDDGGRVCPWDGTTMGELQVRGPWVTGDYVDGVAADRFTPDGWFATGDIVVVDPHGVLRIVDRSADLIKSGGEWISSLDLEAVLLEHPGVRQAAVISTPDERWSERPVAVVIADDDVTADELRALLLERFAKWQVPDQIQFVAEIPVTATGKINKRQLRQQVNEERA